MPRSTKKKPMKLADFPKLVEGLEFLNKGFKEKVPYSFSYNREPNRDYSIKFSSRENAALCFIAEEGIIASSNQACYAGLGRHPDELKWEETGIAIGSKLFFGGQAWAKSKYKPTEEEQIMYMDWVMNRSPYAPIFLLHDAKEAFDNGVVFADVNAPANLMFFGLNATRYTHEFTNIVHLFCDMVKAGVNEHLAFLCGHCISFDGFKNTIGFMALNSGHACLEGGISETVFKSFINNNPKYLATSYKKNSNYYGCMKIFGGEEYSGSTWLIKRLTDISKKCGGYSDNNTNPFGQTAHKSVSYNEFIKVLAENQDILINPSKKAA